MILIGDPQYIPLWNDIVVYNYSSPIEGIPKLNLMPPQFACNSEYEFDMMYANWLLGDPGAFHDLMVLMYTIYEGYNVYLCATTIDMMQSINDSFMKFIQQRYGINCYVINYAEDLECVSDRGVGFSIEGLGNFDMDKERSAITAIALKKSNSDDHSYDFISKRHYTENVEYGPI